MEVIRVLLHVGILYLFYYFGMWLQQWLNLPLPGSIIGMLMLFLFFYTRVLRPDWVERGSQLLISHMPLLFLPATVGVISYLNLFAGVGLWLLVISLVSTILVMALSGWTVQLLTHRRARHE
ncbi:CidA/LrgA family protein [Alteribacillus iranensis]|uniref:Holin-like protein n=1 Tax=Alteribacillus iranensis TaxID=930128 RepID=A0A1I2ES32_9BACI|nr:CidA/LrgA family protein [Alteribacillus iranensis]SFE95427.1 holin-like protein [Alteribacillus iranensis]